MGASTLLIHLSTLYAFQSAVRPTLVLCNFNDVAEPTIKTSFENLHRGTQQPNCRYIVENEVVGMTR
ncbi:hypothetical protein Y032_0618g702 [Ancylostoma ceylanicum]|uniref:Uncharacterized protein n=1 Tax=Ancylostoma ceylanicum TaxID=53326 RepID=A0A016WKH4_9BILA|nr:hypothetical protein Y032_0618g702 [Ancylostoma ceylanicum]